MAEIRTDVRIDWGRLRGLGRQVDTALKNAVKDIADDLARTASEAAPHDKGILEKSYAKEVTVTTGQVEGTVEFSLRETYSGGNFNYAMKMHEGNYQLGPGSEAKPGGTGMSGTHYSVGKKFLTRPLEGETETYKRHIEEELQRLLED